MKKKLLFFHFDLSGGGAEKVLVNLLNGLNPDKYDITLFLLFKVGSNLDALNPNICLRYVFKRPFRGITTLLKLFSPRVLHKFFIKEKYDVEIAYIEFSPTRIVSGCPNTDTRKIAWVHSCKINMPGSFRSEKEMRECYEHFDRIIFVSEQSEQSFIATTGWKDLPYHILPNVMDVNAIYKQASDSIIENINPELINFCSIGKLEKLKGSIRLMECMSDLDKQGILNWHLYYIGTGSAKAEIEAIVSSNGIADKVTFVGYQSNPYKYLSRMDFFVCPSYFEGYSTSAIEALILGIPVVTTDCGGMQEILDHGRYGLIVGNSTDELRLGIYKFITDKNLRNDYKKKAEVRSSFFNPQSVLRLTENMIDQL